MQENGVGAVYWAMQLEARRHFMLPTNRWVSLDAWNAPTGFLND
jgi:hypothetical protein